jgi:hypothetical protein
MGEIDWRLNVDVLSLLHHLRKAPLPGSFVLYCSFGSILAITALHVSHSLASCGRCGMMARVA